MKRSHLILSIIVICSILSLSCCIIISCVIIRNVKALVQKKKAGVMDKIVELIKIEDMDSSVQKTANDILSCLQERDTQKLVTLFCPNIISENPHIDKDVEKLINKLQVSSYEILDVITCEAAKFGGGRGIVQWEAYCKIKINGAEYYMLFIYIRKNYSQKDDIGLSSLGILNYQGIKHDNHDDMNPGIYKLEELKIHPVRAIIDIQ